ncbi:MAG: YfcE family phosphodiesterase [Candidatus Aminicenantes bacterium]|nr:YfcE family phosphodiesterase [Candidatus Aminicenantes bacterium]
MIGIMADSHDNLRAVKKAVRLFNEERCSLVVHAGDFVAPFAAKEMQSLKCPVKAVFGNCDGEKQGLEKAFQSLGEIREAPFSFKENDLTFLVVHFNFPLKPYLSRGEYDVLIFAHTHKSEIRKEEATLLINPGETGGWLSGKSTVALLDPESLSAQIKTL